MERFNLKNNEADGKKQHRVKVSNRFAALEDLHAEANNINIAWKMIRENITISAKENLGYYGLKQYKPWFDEGCSALLDQRKQAKLQWLQDPCEINVDNLKNVRPGQQAFQGKKREYLKDKINELATNSKNKNIRNLCGRTASLSYRILGGLNYTQLIC
jgi:hypothetical protein